MSDPAALRVLADFLASRREQITSEWTQRVRAKRSIPSADELPHEELLDHLPWIFDQLLCELREANGEIDQVATKCAAEAHGEDRWQHDYKLDEVLREIAELRRVLGGQLAQFQGDHPWFFGAQEGQALDVVHSFCDELAIASTTRFVGRQQEELRASNAALAEAKAHIEKTNDDLVERDDRRLRTLRTVSHETRNHLNAISVVVMILEEDANDLERRQHFSLLSRNLGEITLLMNQLLDLTTLLSGGEQADLEACDLADLHHELALFLTEMARLKGLRFTGNVDGSLGSVVSDRSKLHRIAMNLATNAVKYTAAGEVRLIFREHDDGHWAIEVSDTGPGIAPEEHERIFQEFHRISANSAGQSGAGLGLAITQQLVSLLGGRIELASELGRGTQFRVLFPRG